MQHMHNTPSNRPSSDTSKRFGKTSTLVQRGIFGTSVAAIALLSMFDRDEQPAAQIPVAKAVGFDNSDQIAVSALTPENVIFSDPEADAVRVQTVSHVVTTEAPKVVAPAPRTIDDLPEGVNLLDTPIMIRSGNDKFVLTIKDGGATLHVQELGSKDSGKNCTQKALGEGVFFGFKKVMGPYDISWPDVQIITGDEKDKDGKVIRKNVKLLSIRGQQKGGNLKAPKEKPESVIADLCLNLARNGVISYKVDPELGFEVTITASEKKE
jgi:hypothetical protein